MVRRVLVVTWFAASLLTLAAACDKPVKATGEDGAVLPKQICKMNNECWICPDEATMKKCILNPGTSGCKKSPASECEP